MAFQSVPGCALVEVVYQTNAEIWENTFYGYRPGGYSLGDITALATAADFWARTIMLPDFSTDTIFQKVVVTGLENEEDFQVTEATNVGAVGSVAGAPYPNNVSIAVSRRSGVTGRSARGRVYLPLCVGQLTSNENFVAIATYEAFIDDLNAVKTFMLSIGWVEVIVSRFHANAKRAEGVAFTVDSYSITDARVDSQRGRLPKPE